MFAQNLPLNPLLFFAASRLWQELYFSCAVGSVLESAAKDSEAVLEYRKVKEGIIRPLNNAILAFIRLLTAVQFSERSSALGTGPRLYMSAGCFGNHAAEARASRPRLGPRLPGIGPVPPPGLRTLFLGAFEGARDFC